MPKVRHLAEGSPLPEWFLDELQEFVSTYVSPNFAVTILNPTTLQIVAGAGDAQVSAAIVNPSDATKFGWRWNAATVTAAAPGGLTVGDNDVFITAYATTYGAPGTPPPAEVNTTASVGFGLQVLPVGTTPSGSAAVAWYRKVAKATWSGSAFTDVRPLVGAAAPPSSADRAGLLAARPGAGAVLAGTKYLATDDHGGRVARSDGSAWAPTAPPVNGEWPLGAVAEWPWGSGSIPAYAVLPYGQAIAQASYPDINTLDVAAGRPHGTSSGNVVLPDYRGRTGVGKDDMGGSAANRITAAISGVNGATLGAVFGAEGITLTTGQLPPHSHGVTGAPSYTDPTHQHVTTSRAVYTANGGGLPGFDEGLADYSQWSGPGGVAADVSYVWRGLGSDYRGVGIVLAAGTLGTASVGSGSAHQNTQPSIIVNKLMRAL